MTPAQFRAARSLLNINIRDMAKKCGLSVMTLVRFEAGVTVNANSLGIMEAAIARLGVALIDADGVQGEGVRLAHCPETDPPSKALH